MKISEIIESLRHCHDYLPENALQAASEQWQEVRPYLLEELAKKPETVAKQEDDLFFFSAFLVAENRDTEAFPLLLRFFSTPGETAENILGGGVTESLGEILASTYDGDLDALNALIENRAASICCRIAALDSYLVLLHDDILLRKQVLDYFRYLFATIPENDDSYLYSHLVSNCCTIHPGDLIEEIKQAFEMHRVDEGVVRMADVNRSLDQASDGFSGWESDKYHRLGRVADTLRRWHGFSEEYRSAKRDADKPPKVEPVIQPVRQTAKIGRNEPCPCGSDKKYKKCCLNKNS